jgi:hypothetical protein
MDINSGPQQFVVRAAIAALDRWVRTHQPPPSATRLQHAGATLHRGAHGIALGGIRTPAVEVPVATQSGEPTDSHKVVCVLFGSARPFPPATLTQLYGTKAHYLQLYAADADRTVSAGYVLAADRPAIIAQAQAVPFPG